MLMRDLQELQRGAYMRRMQQSTDPYHPRKDMYDPPLFSIEVKCMEKRTISILLESGSSFQLIAIYILWTTQVKDGNLFVCKKDGHPIGLPSLKGLLPCSISPR